MRTKTRYAAGAALFLSGLVILTLSLRPGPPNRAKELFPLKAAYAQVPMMFEANAGQTDPQVRYLARGSGYTIFLTSKGAVLTLQDRPGDHANSVVRLEMAGANDHATIDAVNRLGGTSNYFLGNDPSCWRRDIPTFATFVYTPDPFGNDKLQPLSPLLIGRSAGLLRYNL